MEAEDRLRANQFPATAAGDDAFYDLALVATGGDEEKAGEWLYARLEAMQARR